MWFSIVFCMLTRPGMSCSQVLSRFRHPNLVILMGFARNGRAGRAVFGFGWRLGMGQNLFLLFLMINYGEIFIISLINHQIINIDSYDYLWYLWLMWGNGWYFSWGNWMIFMIISYELTSDMRNYEPQYFCWIINEHFLSINQRYEELWKDYKTNKFL